MAIEFFFATARKADLFFARFSKRIKMCFCKNYPRRFIAAFPKTCCIFKAMRKRNFQAALRRSVGWQRNAPRYSFDVDITQKDGNRARLYSLASSRLCTPSNRPQRPRRQRGKGTSGLSGVLMPQGRRVGRFTAPTKTGVSTRVRRAPYIVARHPSAKCK